MKLVFTFAVNEVTISMLFLCFFSFPFRYCTWYLEKATVHIITIGIPKWLYIMKYCITNVMISVWSQQYWNNNSVDYVLSILSVAGNLPESQQWVLSKHQLWDWYLNMLTEGKLQCQKDVFVMLAINLKNSIIA